MAMAQPNEGGSLSTEKCAVCLKHLQGCHLGKPENCDHVFCFPCIHEWSKNVNNCPVDRISFNYIQVYDVNRKSLKKVFCPNHSLNDVLQDDDITYCEICNDCHDEERLLLCDGCDKGYHLYCLTPPAHEIPVGDWYCPTCLPIIMSPYQAQTGECDQETRDERVVTEKGSESTDSEIYSLPKSFKPRFSQALATSSDSWNSSDSESFAPPRRKRHRFLRYLEDSEESDSSESYQMESGSKQRAFLIDICQDSDFLNPSSSRSIIDVTHEKLQAERQNERSDDISVHSQEPVVDGANVSYETTMLTTHYHMDEDSLEVYSGYSDVDERIQQPSDLPPASPEESRSLCSFPSGDKSSKTPTKCNDGYDLRPRGCKHNSVVSKSPVRLPVTHHKVTTHYRRRREIEYQGKGVRKRKMGQSKGKLQEEKKRKKRRKRIILPSFATQGKTLGYKEKTKSRIRAIPPDQHVLLEESKPQVFKRECTLSLHNRSKMSTRARTAATHSPLHFRQAVIESYKHFSTSEGLAHARDILSYQQGTKQKQVCRKGQSLSLSGDHGSPNILSGYNTSSTCASPTTPRKRILKGCTPPKSNYLTSSKVQKEIARRTVAKKELHIYFDREICNSKKATANHYLSSSNGTSTSADILHRICTDMDNLQDSRKNIVCRNGSIVTVSEHSSQDKN